MKIVGLITEYNPFHNGHLYHIRKSKELAGADYCIALMSGSYVQRGAPAIYDKYVRASMALSSGADLVLEMPVAFSTASAREFASYGVALFTALGAVDSICFGSECGDIAPLSRIAGLLADEPEEFSRTLKECLKQGMTYPEARHQALLSSLSPDEQAVLASPNNILGIEYIRAGITLGSPLRFHTIRREGQAYHDTALLSGIGNPDCCLASASAIRRIVASGQNPPLPFTSQNPPIPSASQDSPDLADSPETVTADALSSMVPACVHRIITREQPIFSDDFSSILNYRIMKGDWIGIADLTPELDARIRKNALSPISFEKRIQELKTRQLTYTRVSRALLHLILDLHESDIDIYKENGYALYARVLGFRKDSLPLLGVLKRSACIPLTTKLADAGKLLDGTALSMLEQEIKAAHIYQMIRASRGGIFRNEYTQGVIVCDTGAECSP
ncbi:tRNA(Met) cytidine acetate ligase [Clostridium transplantifaecale]|uniref:tRNA(Met) cytidine acetate ligase n=1 Tax=Clostridium transplantifaecale TaxID=2479838 RepID=UPI000F63273A|nr:nucleotidyltransferase family protein [Clostridium transplantifaecale]